MKRIKIFVLGMTLAAAGVGVYAANAQSQKSEETAACCSMADCCTDAGCKMNGSCCKMNHDKK